MPIVDSIRTLSLLEGDNDDEIVNDKSECVDTIPKGYSKPIIPFTPLHYSKPIYPSTPTSPTPQNQALFTSNGTGFYEPFEKTLKLLEVSPIQLLQTIGQAIIQTRILQPSISRVSQSPLFSTSSIEEINHVNRDLLLWCKELEEKDLTIDVILCSSEGSEHRILERWTIGYTPVESEIQEDSSFVDLDSNPSTPLGSPISFSLSSSLSSSFPGGITLSSTPPSNTNTTTTTNVSPTSPSNNSNNTQDFSSNEGTQLLQQLYLYLRSMPLSLYNTIQGSLDILYGVSNVSNASFSLANSPEFFKFPLLETQSGTFNVVVAYHDVEIGDITKNSYLIVAPSRSCSVAVCRHNKKATTSGLSLALQASSTTTQTQPNQLSNSNSNSVTSQPSSPSTSSISPSSPIAIPSPTLRNNNNNNNININVNINININNSDNSTLSLSSLPSSTFVSLSPPSPSLNFGKQSIPSNVNIAVPIISTSIPTLSFSKRSMSQSVNNPLARSSSNTPTNFFIPQSPQTSPLSFSKQPIKKPILQRSPSSEQTSPSLALNFTKQPISNPTSPTSQGNNESSSHSQFSPNGSFAPNIIPSHPPISPVRGLSVSHSGIMLPRVSPLHSSSSFTTITQSSNQSQNGQSNPTQNLLSPPSPSRRSVSVSDDGTNFPRHSPSTSPQVVRVLFPSSNKTTVSPNVLTTVPILSPPSFLGNERENFVVPPNSDPPYGPRFAGSFQESILSGHMSTTASTTFPGFLADLGSSGKDLIPPHERIPFSAVYYHIDHDSPYVGTVVLPEKGYRVPQKGLIQLTIFNPTHTPIKTFLVNYDLNGMPPLTKTFLRQKIVTGNPPLLRYAIHLRFASPKKKKFYLYRNIRVVFPNRVPDEVEKLKISYEAPQDPKFFPY